MFEFGSIFDAIHCFCKQRDSAIELRREDVLTVRSVQVTLSENDDLKLGLGEDRE